MTDTFDGHGEYNSYNNDDDNDNNYGIGGGGGGGNKRKISSGNSNLGPQHNGDNANHGGGLSSTGNTLNMSGNNGGGGLRVNNIGAGMSVEGLSSGGIASSGGGIVINNLNPGEHGIQLNEKATEYIRECLAEKNRMDRKFPVAEKLLDCEIEKVQTTGRIPSRDLKYADIYREKPLRISQKVLVPIREHPKFNFVGKLLGPKGNSLRRLQEETFCKMTVLGRNSMRDRIKEEELRSSKDPKYAHLNYDLHVEISTVAPPAEAYARIAYAMAELRKYLIPDNNDVIRQEQLRELMDHTGNTTNEGGSHKPSYKRIGGGAGGANGISSLSSGVANLSLGGGSSSGAGGGGGFGKNNTSHHGNSSSAGVASSSYRSPQANSFHKTNIAPKQKVMSILEKARTAMDETYGRGYDDALSYDQHTYDYAFSQAAAHSSQNQTLSGLTSNDYDSDYNRRDYYHHSPNYGGVAGGPAAASIAAQNLNSNPSTNANRSHVNR